MTGIPHNFRTLAEKLQSLRRPATETLPSRAKTNQFIMELLQTLFPQLIFSEHAQYSDMAMELSRLAMDLEDILHPSEPSLKMPLSLIIEQFFNKLPELVKKMQGDAEAIFQGDPAAESIDEVILTYPGFLVIAVYRVAHEFYLMNVPIFPRLLSEIAHQLTGVDIHPGATIGNSLFIDHATGIVIGETAQIGNNVKIYQGVTLGALSVDKGFSGKKRHPTIEDNVIIYSNATILGGDTVVGHDCIIGGNAWLTSSVPPFSTVYQKSDVRVKDSRQDG